MVSSIREFLIRIKAYASGYIDSESGADAAVILVILLVGFGGFGLGRLSAQETSGTPITMHMVASTTNPAPLPLGGQFVASSHGSKYYFPWCGGATSIKESNQVWFNTEAAAQKAGYTPASNCRGLSTP